MAWIVGDSFDYYASTGDVGRSVWDSFNSAGAAMAFRANRFPPGQSINFGNNATFLTKNFGSNESTVYCVFAYYRPGALTGTYPEVWHQFNDGGTAQCTIAMMQNGSIVLLRGSSGGTVIATYSAAFAQDVWTHFQCRVVLDGSAGTFTVRKNGAVSDTFSATGLNTISTANAYANSYANGFGFSTVSTYPQVDDLLIYSASGAAPNTWVGDVRAICLPPVNDTAQKSFTTFPASYSGTFGHIAGTSVCPQPANTIMFSGPYTPVRSGPVSKINITPTTAYTGKIKAAMYINDGPSGGPGTFVGATPETINLSTAGADFTFATPIPVSPAKAYYLAYLIDTTWPGNNGYGNTGSTVYSLAQPYAGGFPASAAPATVVATSMFLPGIATQPAGYNCAFVCEAIANADTDYVLDSTVGDADLYVVDSLPTTIIQSIVGVVSKIYVKKSDAGTRNGQLQVKSGATQVTGVDTALASTYTYLARVDVTDPNTGAGWTIASVNALQVGQKVTL